MQQLRYISVLNKKLTPLVSVFNRQYRHVPLEKPTTTPSYGTDEVTIPLKKYKLHKLDNGVLPLMASLTKTDALDYYRQMISIRSMEGAVWSLFESGHAYGQSHLASGQEACAVGISSVLRVDDAISCSHRNHAWAFLKGIPIQQVLAEIIGRSTGASKGKGGSMHLYKKETNFFGGSAIVGSQVSLGAGMALAMKNFRRNGVCVAFYGEGAANQGQVFEAFNMSKLWDLPVIYVCENNQISRQSDVHRTTASTEFYTRGDYIPGIWVNGMDILTVREASSWAVNYCRSGYGPIILEVATSHLHGHALTKGNYEDLELTEDELTTDPIAIFKKTILDHQLCGLEELQHIDSMIESETEDAVRRAKNDNDPKESEIYTDIYTGITNGKIRGCDAMSYYKS